ncbi:MAG: autotransporter-associated beta strand repeat-containing protein, partial [Ferruginibacter sp.]
MRKNYFGIQLLDQKKAIQAKIFGLNRNSIVPFSLFFIILLSFTGVKAQTTFSWRNDQSPANNVSWLNTSPYYFWNGSAGAIPGGADILYFDGAQGTTMTNNLTATNRFKITFGSGGSARTINGSTSNTFFDYSGVWPWVRNESSVLQTIGFPIVVGNTGAYHLELIANSAALEFTNTINNNSRNILIYGNNSALDAANRYIRFSNVVSGSGVLNVSQFGAVRINAAQTYTGETQIDNGELWIESSGSISSSSTIYVGNGGQLSNTAKLWLSNASGSTTFSNNFTINTGNANTREVGGLNTSGTHTFSGNITNNSSNFSLVALNAGGTTAFTGAISGSNPIATRGAGIVSLSGSNTYTGSTTINAGTLRLGAANTIPNTSNLTLNADGVTFSTGATTGNTDQLGTLDLEGNATLALGTGVHTLTFANSSSVSWNLTKTLTVTGWTGTAGVSGSAGRIIVGAG